MKLLIRKCKFCDQPTGKRPFKVKVNTADGQVTYKCCEQCARTLSEIQSLIRNNADDAI